MYNTNNTLHITLALCLSLLLSTCGNTNSGQAGTETVDKHEAEITARFIAAIKAKSLTDHPESLMKRFNQSKSVACLNGDFEISDALPKELQQGIFATPGHYKTTVRFANARQDDDREKDFRGMSIKVLGVENQSLSGESGRQDFLLNSYPALFAGTPAEFLDFVEASKDDALWRFFIKPSNWDSLLIILQGRAQISNPLAIRYWSTTPSRFGSDNTVAVKYSTQPCHVINSAMPDDAHADFFRDAIATTLDKGKACFDFMVQFQTDPSSMPIEDASIIWDETKAPFHKLARITFPTQAFGTLEALDACEKQAFHPWQGGIKHQPIGGINRVRKAIYSEISAFRSQHNQGR